MCVREFEDPRPDAVKGNQRSTCGTPESYCCCEVSKRAGDKMCGFHANRTESRLHARGGGGFLAYEGKFIAHVGWIEFLMLAKCENPQLRQT